MALLDIRGVSKSFGANHVLNEFSMRINEGELRCLVGPNGAGKTTAMDVITGRQRIDAGIIAFDGHPISRWPEQKRARAGIARKFQIPAVFKELTVRENLEVACCSVTNPFSNMLRWRDRMSLTRFGEVIDLIGLEARLGITAGMLSHGESQWLEIGIVLMQNPRLMLMDEPTAGMTEAETRKTALILNRLKTTHTLVVVEHDMAFVRSIADRVTVMHMGATLAEGTMAEIEADTRVRDVYLGTEAVDA